MTRRLLLVVFAAASMAHVGSPDTFFTGSAGPYPVRVSVRLPGVIPGLAQINVRVPSTPSPSDPSAPSPYRITVQAIQWNLGPEGAPPPDVATLVPGDAELYAADLWLMVPTSYRVHVVVDGPRGQGTAIVPVMAIAMAQREMPRGLGIILAGLGLFLVVGLVTIIGVAVRESGVPPGEMPPPARTRRARFAMAIAAVLLVVMLVGGRAWWDAEAFAYGESVVFRPFRSAARVTDTSDGRMLRLTIDDRRWPPPPGNITTRYNALMPDHGKLMHMFLVREPALDAFAHVHPVPESASGTTFDVALPPLPSGRYRVYGDIVHESGYAQTLVASVVMEGGTSVPPVPTQMGDADDSWFTGAATAESTEPVFRFADGSTLTWMRGAAPLHDGDEHMLTFVVRDPSGAPAALEPYMGMLGHIVVARSDGDVFAHLHPSGSISMAAMQKFSPPGDAHAGHGASANAATADTVSTPYAFPKDGRYRLWVQIKRQTQVMTAAFDVEVQ